PATDLDDDYFDMLQEELCSVVEASGASLEKGRHDQLLTALRALLLSRKNPFGDIKADGTVKTALENLGLGEAAKRNVGTGSGQIPDMSSFASALSSSGYQKLPSGLIIQWGAAVAGIGSTGGTGNVVSFPVAFPRYCAQIITSYDNGSSSIIAGAAGNQTTTQFLLRCGATGGSYNFRWLAVGY
ncbi:TPA: hypothetical protein ACNEY2_003469, partial [Escherichia coli]